MYYCPEHCVVAYSCIELLKKFLGPPLLSHLSRSVAGTFLQRDACHLWPDVQYFLDYQVARGLKINLLQPLLANVQFRQDSSAFCPAESCKCPCWGICHLLSKIILWNFFLFYLIVIFSRIICTITSSLFNVTPCKKGIYKRPLRTETWVRSPIKLLFSRLNKPSSYSLSSHDGPPNPLLLFVVLL